MSNGVLSKGKQTAYERWEMSALTSDRGQAAKKIDARAPAPKVAENLVLIIENARKEGYAKGVQEGYIAGLEQGRAAIELQQQEWLTLTGSLKNALKEADDAIANELLDLALDISRAMIKSALVIDPTKIVAIVKYAIRQLPVVVQPAKIIVHPEDAQILLSHIAERLAEEGWLIEEDASIERGGCMIETASNQIDASNATRWKRINESLGKLGDWIGESDLNSLANPPR